VTDYNAPLDDIKFCLRYAAGLDEILKLSAYEGVEIDDVDPILDEAGRFAHEVVAPTNRIGDEQSVSVKDGVVKVPAEFAVLNQQLVENGWPALGGSPEHDGMGLPETVEFATSEMWQSANMAFSLLTMLTRDATHLIKAHANDELQQTYLPKITTGQWAATMDLTEPQAGSDLAAVKAKAIPDGDVYRIFGNKVYITWGDHELTENIIHLVLARIDGAPEGVRGISLFLVPKFLLDADGNPGARNDLVATSVEHKLGIHGSPTCVLNYGEGDGAIGYLVGEENKGLAAMFTMMNHARVEVGLQGVAISERACQLARSYAHDRVQGRAPGQSGRAPIIYHADVRRMLLLMRSQTEAMRALAYATASQLDKLHHEAREEAQKAAELRLSVLTPVVKGWNTETAQEVTSLGVQIHGGMGYVEETGAAQHMRDARILPIYEGTTGIQALDFAGRKVLGDEAREIGSLIGELKDVCDAMEKDDALQSVGRDVRQGLEQLEQGVAWLLGNAADNPTVIGTASVNLLMLAGVVLGGAYLAKATLALRSDGESVDASFADTKLATTRFYCGHVLPRAHGYLAAATADPGATMDLDVDAI
jgi:acyl-CoA dehydrogenase